eukprot:scaffold37163_cov19-Tisochrysis_lutea.AAC.1
MIGRAGQGKARQDRTGQNRTGQNKDRTGQDCTVRCGAVCARGEENVRDQGQCRGSFHELNTSLQWVSEAAFMKVIFNYHHL